MRWVGHTRSKRMQALQKFQSASSPVKLFEADEPDFMSVNRT